MKAFKGCVNPNCDSCKKHKKYSRKDTYCKDCGCRLEYVCSDCWTVLENGSDNLCVHCKAQRRDKVDHAIDTAKKAAGAVTAVAAAGVTVVANVGKIIGKK